MTARRRVVAIVNPVTRRNADTVIRTLRLAVPSHVNLEVFITEAPGDALSMAQAAVSTADLLVAIGGDGTVADVATAISGTGIVLGIIPAGSTNITARELGIPNQPAAAAALLFGPHRLACLDLGRSGDRSFLHMAGAGFDAHFFAGTSQALKRRLGWFAYLPAAVAALRQPPAEVTITADGQTTVVSSRLVLVANGASVITPLVRLHPAIRSDDGWLDVLVFTADGPTAIARTLAGVATSSLAMSPFVVQARARHVRLVADPALPIQLDGDVVGSTPATFEIEPAALRVIAPHR